MFLAGFTDPGAIPVTQEQRDARAAAEEEDHVRNPLHFCCPCARLARV
jgi:hypothetical protein